MGRAQEHMEIRRVTTEIFFADEPITRVGRYYTQATGLEVGIHSEALVW